MVRTNRSDVADYRRTPVPHVTSLRLPDDVYAEILPIIRRRGMSFNAFVEDTLRRELQAEMDREMYEAGTILGDDPGSDVDFALAAQAEVVLRDQ
jgi:hypothetical protein